jgi:Na+/H+ antiporter NhaD/arsenite permease-like protein
VISHGDEERIVERLETVDVHIGNVNNLPAAAGVHALTASGAWATVPVMAIGPNLLLTGSVATIICRRMTREAGADFDPVRFSLVGVVLTPALLIVAFAGLHPSKIV